MSVVRNCKNNDCKLKVRDGETCSCGLASPLLEKIQEFESIESLKPSTWLQLCAAVMLVFALDNQPSEYYVFLRVVVFIASIWNIKEYYFNSKNDDFAMVVVICSAITLVLFNPIVPIYFWDKTEWIFPDILASIFFLVVAFQDYKIKDSNSANREAQDKNFKSQKVFHDANFSCDCGALNNKRNVGVTCGKCKSKVIAVT
ncbi:MAG: hypothetical protein HOJ14_12755 [Nitrospina sp.]|jgi:hypothetical protein|nr:hypothetical protein [Nitrospina sp.]